MACSPGIWNSVVGIFAASILLAAIHTDRFCPEPRFCMVVRMAVIKAETFARDHTASSSSAPPDSVSAKARNSEVAAASELGAVLTRSEVGAGWARWFGLGEAVDDDNDEDAVKMMLKEADVLDEQWHFQAAERKLREALQRAAGWSSDMQEDMKPSPQRNRAKQQEIEVRLQLGRFLEDHGRLTEAVSSFREAAKLPADLAPQSNQIEGRDGEELLETQKVDALKLRVRSDAALARALCLLGGRRGSAVREARALFAAAVRQVRHPQRLESSLEAQVHADFAQCLHAEGALTEARGSLAAARRALAEDEPAPLVEAPAGSLAAVTHVLARPDLAEPVLSERARLQRRLMRLQGGVSHDDGAFAEAARLYGEYLEAAPRMDRDGELPALVEVVERFKVMQDLSLALSSLGKMEDAFASMDDVDRLQKATREEIMLKSGSASRNFLAPRVEDLRLRSSTARSMVVRAELVLEQSRMQQQRPPVVAEQLAKQSVAILHEVVDPMEDLENALNTLGNVQMSLREAGQAQAAYGEAVKLAEMDHGTNSSLVAALYHNLGSALEAINKVAEAIDLYRKALHIQLTVLGKANPDTAGSLDSIARCLAKSGRIEEATEAAERAAQVARDAYPAGHWMRRATEARLVRLRAANPNAPHDAMIAKRVVYRVEK